MISQLCILSLMMITNKIRLAARSMPGTNIISRVFRFSFNLKMFLEYLQSQIRELHIHINRISIDSIHRGNNERISNWLYE
jgi:hypothetical protein